MAKISGILTDGAGQIINDCTIELYAKKTTSNVLTQTQAFTVANDGRYSMNVLPCDYDVSLIINGFPKKRLGTINVYSNSANGTLNDFLINPKESELTPEFIKQVMDARDDAKKSANNAQKWASTIDTSTLVKKSGDTMTGQLILSKNGLKINYDNKNIMALITADDNYSHVFYDAEKKQWLSKLVYNSTINSWSFQYINDVVINGKSVLKIGDAIQTFGDLSTTINLNELTGSNEGIYYQARNASAVTERGYPIGEAGTLQVFKNGADGAGCCQIYTTYRNARQFIRNYRGGTKTWEEWSEVITTGNSGDFIKKGDYGIGSFVGAQLENPDETLKGGCYATRTTEFTELTEYQNRNDSASLVVYPAWTEKWYVEKLAVVCSKTPRIYYRCATPNGKQPFYESITTANSTVDSNGFLKKASPILRLFANDNIEEADGFKKSGCALVNDFAYGVTATRIGVGHYEIHGSLGFAKEGWYITLPEDANGNKKFFAEYSVDENNVITVKTYTKKFDFENCQIVAGKPIDITDGRWVDVRLEMPVIEVIENEEPIPSTLNPVIVSEVPDDI